MKTIGLVGLFLSLSGCSIFQGVYDENARAACRDLPTPDERIACERAADDAARARRQEKLSFQTEPQS